METRKVITLALVCAFASMLSINLAQAATATAATLHTTDASGNDKVQFGRDETVYIHWTADGTVNIKVEFEDGTIVSQWLDQPSSSVVSYKPSKMGYYAIYCTGARVRLVAYGTIFVIPELPLGAITATIAGFGALSAFGIVKLKRTRN